MQKNYLWTVYFFYDSIHYILYQKDWEIFLMSTIKKFDKGFWIGLIICLTMLILPNPTTMNMKSYHTLAIVILMAVWWATNALPLSVTALIPFVAFPILDVASFHQATSTLANKLIFLFLGGFILALAIESTGLHKRIAINIIKRVGVKPQNIIAGFMIAVAFLSAWISNTATAAMMLPIAIAVTSIIDGDKKDSQFSKALLISVAYSASIGGVATLIGTPPNALLAGFIQQRFHYEISFANWMLFAAPLSIIMLIIAWFILTRVLFKFGNDSMDGLKEVFEKEEKNLGAMKKSEKIILVIFVSTALLWILRSTITHAFPWLKLNDSLIAIAAAILCFIFKDSEGNKILDWKFVNKSLPWGVLVLFGGGLSMGSAVNTSGLATWIASQLTFIQGLPLLLMIFIVVITIVILTEFTSNTATAATFLPLISGIAVGISIQPILLCIPLALAASCAFTLPAATPPNSIVFGANKLKIQDLIRSGLAMHSFTIILITLTSYFVVPALFG